MAMRAWLYDELIEWRGRLRSLDLPAGEDDFIVPGAAADGHYTLEQQHKTSNYAAASPPSATRS